MEDCGAGVNVMDDDLEECHSAWKVGDDALFSPDHNFCLGLLGQ